MNQEKFLKEMTFICDLEGKIESFTWQGDFDDCLNKTKDSTDVVKECLGLEYKQLLHEIGEEGYIKDAILSVDTKKGREKVIVNGYYENQKIHMSVLSGCLGTIYLLQEMVGNNPLLKEMSPMPGSEDRLDEYIRFLENYVMRDTLTGVYNERYFNKIIYEEMRIAKQENRSIYLIIFELAYNESRIINHFDRDYILNFVDIAKKIIKEDSELLFRTDTNEFIIISSRHTSTEIYAMVDNINTTIQTALDKIRLFHGLVEITPERIRENFNIITYLKEADQKMYQQKRSYNRKQINM